MKITDQVINELAHLARLEFDEESRPRIKADLERILVFCEQLNEVNTEGVEPLVYLSDVTDGLRTDQPNPPLAKDLALKNAPKADSDYFKIPKVLNKKDR